MNHFIAQQVGCVCDIVTLHDNNPLIGEFQFNFAVGG